MLCGESHRSGKPWTESIKMASVATIDQQSVCGLRSQIVGPEARGECEVCQPLNPVVTRDYETAT
jgi:hypothetical protein